MSWKIISVVGERCRLVRALLRKAKSVAQTCREARISRKAAYRWLKRFMARDRRGGALLRKAKSVAQTCREARLSRKTAYKWLKRFMDRARGGLRDRSRRPR